MSKVSTFFQDPKAQMRLGVILAYLSKRTGSDIDDKAIEGIYNATKAAQESVADDDTVTIEDLVRALLGLLVVAADLTETESDDIVASAMEDAAEEIGDFGVAFRDAGSSVASLMKLIPLVLEAAEKFRAAKEAPEPEERTVNGAGKPDLGAPKVVRATPKRTVTKTPGADSNALGNNSPFDPADDSSN